MCPGFDDGGRLRPRAVSRKTRHPAAGGPDFTTSEDGGPDHS